jgi:hypothetical protein
MRSLEMERSYPLEADTVDEIVSRHAPGNYALGYLEGATFTVFYVGHSDSDVWRSLRTWVGRPSRPERHGSAIPASRGWRALRRTPWDALLPMSVGSDSPSPYTRFAYNYARPPDAASATGPRGFDELGRLGLDNEVAHPTAIAAPQKRVPASGRRPTREDATRSTAPPRIAPIPDTTRPRCNSNAARTTITDARSSPSAAARTAARS